MKKKCIIQLRLVPGHIIEQTFGDIDVGMYLEPDAIKSLLKGDMFSPGDCMWGYAGIVSESKAKQVCKQLAEYNILATIVRLW